MSARKHPELTYSALKAATRRLVTAAGGLEAAASVTRVNKATLGFYTQPTHAMHIAADAIVDLEADVGEPLVTRELARVAGYALVPLDQVEPPPVLDPAHMVVKLSRDVGDFAQSVEDMDQDGIREPHEIRRCIGEIASLIQRAEQCKDMLHQHLNSPSQSLRAPSSPRS